MNITQGNLWDFHGTGVVCITTNGIVKHNGELVMGAGIALQAKQRFPGLPAKLGTGVRTYGNQALYCAEERIISFPTKNDYRNPSDIELIAQSCHQSMAIADHFGLDSVFLPRPGCHNGKLNWSYVMPVISSILDDRFTVVVL